MGSEMFLEVILAIILPPVGVFLRYGCAVSVSFTLFSPNPVSFWEIVRERSFFKSQLPKWIVYQYVVDIILNCWAIEIWFPIILTNSSFIFIFCKVIFWFRLIVGECRWSSGYVCCWQYWDTYLESYTHCIIYTRRMNRLKLNLDHQEQ